VVFTINIFVNIITKGLEGDIEKYAGEGGGGRVSARQRHGGGR
jgi:hypothetical protein